MKKYIYNFHQSDGPKLSHHLFDVISFEFNHVIDEQNEGKTIKKGKDILIKKKENENE